MTLSLLVAFSTAVPSIAGKALRATSFHQDDTCCQPDSLGLDEQIWGENGQPGDEAALLTSIDNSLRYLHSPSAAVTYRKNPVPGITRDRVIRSLERFRELVTTVSSPEELQAAVRREFMLYQATGKDGRGNVLFTAYYEPVYQASRVPTAEYRYPLYRRPPDFESWGKPHPTRAQLEGVDGLGESSRLRGLELVFLRDRMEAFLVHIQGSAQFELTDGTQMTVGYNGKTSYPYTSVGRELAKDGKLPLSGLTLPVMNRYFQEHPEELSNYLPRNRGFVFFKETYGAAATGSIQVPVTAERSIATDKSLMPPGALALIRTSIPFPTATGEMQYRTVSRYVLDQDTGGAIKGPGRVDYFMGSGKMAGDRAGVTGGGGQLYYLLLKHSL